MAATLDEIGADLARWISDQPLFFVATAPSGSDGHVNLSPKGLAALAVLGPRRVAYLDLTGSGVETIAHLRENGRITIMLCAFAGPPRNCRLHGRGVVHPLGTEEFANLADVFPIGAAAAIVTSAKHNGEAHADATMETAQSIDGLAGFPVIGS